MKPDPLSGMLGLCRRAGRIVTGQEGVLSAVRAVPKSRVALAILSSDASERTRKHLTDKCTTYGVPLLTLAMDGYAVGAALGHDSPITSAAVTDSRMAARIRELAEAAENASPDTETHI